MQWLRRNFITGNAYPTKGNLNGKGLKLPAGDPEVYLTYRGYKRQPFGILNLPQSFLQVA